MKSWRDSLEPERAWSGEVGVDLSPGGGLGLSLTGFARRASSLIDWARELQAGDESESPWETRNVERAARFSRETDCAIVVVNGGTYQGDGGEEGEAHLSFTIASPTGEAITRPRHFTRTRRIMNCGYRMV